MLLKKLDIVIPLNKDLKSIKFIKNKLIFIKVRIK